MEVNPGGFKTAFQSTTWVSFLKHKLEYSTHNLQYSKSQILTCLETIFMLLN